MAKLHRHNLFLSPLSSLPSPNLPSPNLPSPFGEGSGVRPGAGVRLSSLTAIIVGILAMSAIAIAVSHHTYRRNLAALLDLQAQNQADTIFRSDSIQLYLVRFFDRHAYTPHGLLHPGRTANNRLLAHYLLGRAHADMGDAPAAIEDYKEAVTCADTTRSDCDYSVLRGVYGQMAVIFYRQNLPQDQIAALRQYQKYAFRSNDTIEAISTYVHLQNAYYLLNDTNKVYALADTAYTSLLEIGQAERAAYAYLIPIHYHLVRNEYEEARKLMDIFESMSDVFDENHIIAIGKEEYLFSVGRYMLSIGNLDSAEVCFRTVFNKASVEEGAKGLMTVYGKRHIADSVFKYSILHAKANDSLHHNMNSAFVHRLNRMYDYSNRQRIADEQRWRAARNGLLAIVIFILGLLTTTFIVIFYKRRQKEKEMELQSIRHAANASYDKLCQALSDYRQLKEDYGIYASKKRHELLMMKQEVISAQLKCERMTAKQGFATLYGSDLVMELRSRVRQDSLKPNSVVDITPKEWKQLENAFAQTFVSYRQNLKPRLTELEAKVCMLMVLDFTNADIQLLLNQKNPQAVSNAKSRVNKRLFDGLGGDNLLSSFKICLFRDV